MLPKAIDEIIQNGTIIWFAASSHIKTKTPDNKATSYRKKVVRQLSPHDKEHGCSIADSALFALYSPQRLPKWSC